eukprot:TRINITY_DN2033_c0_g1_i3.p2 TRINITY_DN2033_c0_g1~~TRINITY_DN2033_c0_g1_i3.p2  ORF type:complete len:175 (-),score=48.78 TRINITY_DN2033_c0_g1_i3:698-1222(-)
MSAYTYQFVAPVLKRMMRQKTSEGKKLIVPMKRWNIIKGDMVEVNTGKEKGKRGIVKDVHRSRNAVIVEGLNLAKKHVKSTPDQKGGIFTKEMPIHYSNLQLIDPSTDKLCKVRRVFTENAENPAKPNKIRISRSTGTPIPKPEWKQTIRPKDGPLDTPSSVVLLRTYFQGRTV